MTPAVVSLHNPFKMLDSFTESDRAGFFGREADGRQLVRATTHYHATLLLGESGVGKTSLIDVALMRPLLARDDLFVIETNCGPDLLDRFSHSLRTLLDENWQRWFKELKQVTWESLTEFLRAFTIERNHNVVLIFDGLEVLFSSQFNEADRKAFFQFLSLIEVGNDRMHVLAALDSRYLADLYNYSKLIPALLANTLVLERMSWEQARSTIEEPFAAAGFSLETGLSRKIYDDAVRICREEGAKRPLTADLQWVCSLYFEVVAREDRPPSLDSYRRHGGAAGLINAYFSTLFGLPGSERRFLSELLLARLVLPGFTTAALDKQKILWVFSGVEASEEELEGMLREWSQARFLRFDADSNTYRLGHPVLKTHMDRFLGLSARLERLQLELTERTRGQGAVGFEFNLHKLEPYFRYRKIMNWSPDELRTVYFSALKQGFPAYWWETLLRRKLGDRGFLEVLTHEFGECEQPQLMRGLCGELAKLDPGAFEGTAKHFDKQVLRLVVSSQQPAGVRRALLELARAWKMEPQPKHYDYYLFVEDQVGLRLAFLDWLGECPGLKEPALLKKWHQMVEGNDPLGDGEQQEVVTAMVALLQRFDEGIEALGEVLMLQEEGGAGLNLSLVLPLLAGFPGVELTTLHQFSLRAFEQQLAHRDERHPSRKLVFDFLKEHGDEELFADIWGRLSETYPLSEDLLQLGVALVRPQHHAMLMMSLYDEDDIIRNNAKRILLALSAPESLIEFDSPTPIEEKPWEARAVLLRCYFARGDQDDLPEGFQSPAKLESNADVLWANEYLTAYFESRPPQEDWIMLLEEFSERLRERNQALLPELKLPGMQEWAGKAWRRIDGHWRRGLSAITRQSAELFGENAKEDIRLRLAKMRASMQDWVTGAQRVYGTLDQNRAVTMRLILKKLGNLLKSLDEKHEQFEGYCRRIDLAPLANRHLRSFLEAELIGFWELHAQNLNFLHERLRASGETEDSKTWTQLVVDFGSIVDQSAADIEFWRDCLPQLRDRELLECLLLNHRGYLQVRRTMLSRLGEAGSDQSWVRDYLIAQFGKTKTEFDDLEWRTIIKGLSGSSESDLADRFSLAIQTHKGLEPQILDALRNMGSLKLVDDEQLCSILLHPKTEIREAVIPIMVSARPDLVRQCADRIVQIGEESTILLLLDALAEIGTVADLRLFLGHRGLLVNGLWLASQETMGAVIRKTVTADKRWFESGGLKSLQ
ncbi:ATP-binding protein [Acanthopleuribacter pedis]|uniref:ATP-binding protein n=1 Tax=Acanthopleuribacter pedis TaxID=442870 RepID=A0A8J7U4N0_9BACT|nr:ATP-binding protein [Acanthopleuribacter pedis]MBO1318471.1 ATP-binding protein [Acanthopleuribacter pedis]